MPELPELEVLKKRLKNNLSGKVVIDVKLLKPYILKTYKINFIKLIGKELKDVTRIGKWLILDFGDIYLFYHPLLTGNLTIKEYSMRDTAFMISFGNVNLIFNETGNKKISEIYLYLDKEEFFKNRRIGLDPFSNDFNIEYISEKLQKEKRPLYKVLIDQSIFPGIGVAYMNEILFEAKLFPFKKGINKEEIVKLYEAIQNVLKSAINEIEKIDEKIEIKETRGFTKVYRKKKCPLCESEIKQVFLSELTIYYCPFCQKGGFHYS